MCSGGAVKNENVSNQQINAKLHKPNITKYEKQKVFSSC